MDREEVTKWLTIMKANLNSFPEVSNAKEIEALAEAIRLLKNEQSEKTSSSEMPNKSESPTGSNIKNDLGVDYISRQDVLSEIIRFSTEEGSSVECQQLYCDVNNMPSVTPQEPKTGHWVGIDEYPHEDYECDNCGFIHTFIDGHTAQYNYCPNCGADMRGEK